MPKNRTYEYDYEWTGQENKSNGVNLHEKNQWSKPSWGSAAKPVTSGQTSYTTQSDRFGMEKLQQRHQWEKPNWATAKDKNSNKEILRDPIPKPTLKKTPGPATGGCIGTPSSGMNTIDVTDADMEIAEMERRIEEAKQKKAALAKLKDDEDERTKHTVEDSKLERARRLAKEREEGRWRETLQERNARDKEKREQARLAALASQSGTNTSDAVWQKTQEEQQQRHQKRVQEEAAKRQCDKTTGRERMDQQQRLEQQERYVLLEQEQILQQRQRSVEAEQATTMLQTDNQYQQKQIYGQTGHDYEDVEEYDEEEIVEEDEGFEGDELESYDEVEDVSNGQVAESSTVDELQRQIDALRRQLAGV